MGSHYTKEVKKTLNTAGCSFLLHGNGDHEIWFSPISNKHFPVDGNIKSRHTANSVLRQAGLQKQF